MIRLVRVGAVISSLVLLSACTGGLFEKGDSAPSNPPDVSRIPNAVPKTERIRPQNQKSYVVFGKRYYPMKSAAGYREKGIASWYGNKFHGRQTAIGERYDMYQMTAAHKTLPLPSYAEVTNLNNGRKIIVRVNDRGPFHGSRIIDLSYSAAKKLDIIGQGTGQVEVRAISAKTYANQVAKPVSVAGVKPEVPAAQAAESLPSGYHTHEGDIQADDHDVVGPAVYLQVGTFSSIERAESFKSQLAEQIKETVFLMPLYRPQGALYRVRVGPLANVEASESMAVKLKSLGVPESHAVVE
jgi:rare lipoprotein A